MLKTIRSASLSFEDKRHKLWRFGKVAVAGVNLIAKRPKEVGKAITSAALVETYAIFAVLISLLMVLFAPVG